MKRRIGLSPVVFGYASILECLLLLFAQLSFGQPAETFTLLQNAPHLQALMKKESCPGVRSIAEVDDLVSELQSLERDPAIRQIQSSLVTAQRMFERQRTCLNAVEKVAKDSEDSEAAMEDSFEPMLNRQRNRCMEYGRQGLKAIRVAYHRSLSDTASPAVASASSVSPTANERSSSPQAGSLF